MATKKLSNSEIKKKKCTYPDPPDEGLPIWMGTFADMMTLLFAFFVLLYSMSTPDPVKYAAFANSQATKLGGSTDQKMEVEPQDAKDIDEAPSTLAIENASPRHPSVAMPFQPEDVHCTLQKICM